MSSTEHDVPRDRVKEMEARLLSLSGRHELTRSRELREEYQRLYPKWRAAKAQLRMNV
jgi:hypothetical protein